MYINSEKLAALKDYMQHPIHLLTFLKFIECFLNALTIIQRMKIILILPVLVTFNQNVVNDLFQNTKK